MPENAKPGYYNLNLDFGEKACGDSEKDIPMQVLYPKDILAQRWGDVLAVKNEDYNGGYEFVAFQWYKNGQPIIGATSSICYIPEGLDLSAEYAVLLTRKVDNVSIMTCVAELVDASSAEDSRIVVFSAKEEVAVETTANAKVKIWSLHGLLLDEVFIEEGYNVLGDIVQNGVCLLEFIFEDGHREIKQVIVK